MDGSAPRPARPQAVSGFPSPADGAAEASLDVRALLVRRPAATFFLRMGSDRQRAAGIFPGDILVVDRSLAPAPGRLVIVATGGELRVTRWQPSRAASADDASDEAGRDSAVLWGAVTYVIHQADALPDGSADGYPPLGDALDVG